MFEFITALLGKPYELSFVSVLLRIVLSMILGGILGAERSKVNQAAGMRTYMLVTLGAAMVMMTGEYTYHIYAIGDPARLGAQVISGIGFLGAGSILVQARTKIRGLTTAAGLWVAACIGITIGIGFYSGAIVATIAVYFIMDKFKTVSNYVVATHQPEWFGLYLELDAQKYLNDVVETLTEFGISMGQVSVKRMAEDGQCTVVVSAKAPHWITNKEVIEYVEDVEGVQDARYVQLQ